MIDVDQKKATERSPVLEARQRPSLRALAVAYRRGLDCDAAYLTTIASLVGGTPLCRPKTSSRSRSARIVGLFFLLIDYITVSASAALSLLFSLANWSPGPKKARGIFLFSQQRFQRFSGFIEPKVDPVLYSLNLLRVVRQRTFQGTFLERIPAWRIPGLAARALLLQGRFWIDFISNPDWRVIAYTTPCWGRAVEFLQIQEIVKSVPEGCPIWCTSILDRTISWLNELRRINPFYLGVVQHGAFEGSRVPHRVEVDELICLPWSDAFYRRYIGNPLKVLREPELIRFQTPFRLLADERPDIVGVGFISQQCLSSRAIELLEKLIERVGAFSDLDVSSLRILVYPHPLEDHRLFSELARKHPSLIEVSGKVRHSDLVLAISQYSTLAMEYSRLDVPTIVNPPPGFEVDFFDLPGITVVRNDQEFLTAFETVIRQALRAREAGHVSC